VRRLAAVFVLTLAAVTSALASHSEPAKANKASFTLVNGFSECDPSFPNTAMQSNGTAACTPPVHNGVSLCSFGSNGSGKLTFTKIGSASDGTQDLKISASATGLDSNCLSLHVLLEYRLTSDDCPEGSCTGVDQTADLIGVECMVMNGKCKIKTTLNTAAPGTIPNGKNAGIDILGCGLREAFPAAPVFGAELRCGVLLK
jgi:hypothetical protein